MGQRNRIKVAVVTTGRTRFLQAEIRETRADRSKARAAKSWSAVAALARQIQSLRLEYDQEVERRRVEAAAAVPEPGETPELRAARVLDHSRSAPLDELETYVREWCARHKHELFVTDVGEIAIRRL